MCYPKTPCRIGLIIPYLRDDERKYKQFVMVIPKFHPILRGLKSKREGRNNKFQQAISSLISDELSTNKDKLNTAFNNGFYSNEEH